MRAVFAGLLLLGALCLSTPLSADDEQSAQALLDAQSALDAEDYAKACTLAEAAMDDRANNRRYYEAAFIRGQAHMGKKETKKGLAWIREVLLGLEALVPLSDEDRDLWGRARKTINAVSRSDASLHKMMSKQSGKLVGISKKWLKKDPKTAERAALAALALDPASKRAGAALAAARKAMGALPQELLEVSKMAGWKGLTDKNWPRENGVLVGHVDHGAMMLTTKREWSGNFDVVFEARITKLFRNNGPPLFGIVFPYISDDRYVTLSVTPGQAELYEWTSRQDGTTHGKKALSDLGKKIDPKKWLRYELRARGDEIIALVGGVEVARQPRPATLKAGHVAMKVQFCRVEIRSVTIAGR